MKKKYVLISILIVVLIFIFTFPFGMNDDFSENTSFYSDPNNQRKNFEDALYNPIEVDKWLQTDETPKDFKSIISDFTSTIKRVNEKKQFQNIKIDSTKTIIYSESGSSVEMRTYNFNITSYKSIAKEHLSIKVIPNGYDTIVDLGYVYDFSDSNFLYKTYGKWKYIFFPSSNINEIEKIKRGLMSNLKEENY